MSDNSEFDLNNVDPMEVGRQLGEIYEEYGPDAAVRFVDKLAATFGINVIVADKDNGHSSEYIYTRIKAFIMYCGLLYEIRRQDENDERD
jgi:hypothetical protein